MATTTLPAGEMSDSAEVLDVLYQQIKQAAMQRGLAAGVDAVFGLGVREAVDCSACHKTTHQTSYTQHFYNTQVGPCHLGAGAVGP